MTEEAKLDPGHGFIDDSQTVSKHVFVLQKNGLQKSHFEGRPMVESWSVILTDPGADTVKMEGGLDISYLHEKEGWMSNSDVKPIATLSEAILDGIRGMLEDYLDIDDVDPDSGWNEAPKADPETPCGN